MTDLIAAEWLKLRTTRLLVGMIPAAVGLSLAAVAGMVVSSHTSELETAEGMRRVFSVAGAGAIVVLVVGVLISAGEYHHRTAGDTFLTTPRRARVLGAKLIVAASLGAVVGAVTAAACVAAAAVVYRTEAAALSITTSDVLLAIPATAIYTALFATLGVALGGLVRNQVAAAAGSLAWIALVEHTLVNLLPSVGRWLPVGAGQAIVRTPIDGLLAPPTSSSRAPRAHCPTATTPRRGRRPMAGPTTANPPPAVPPVTRLRRQAARQVTPAYPLAGTAHRPPPRPRRPRHRPERIPVRPPAATVQPRQQAPKPAAPPPRRSPAIMPATETQCFACGGCRR